MRRRDEEVEADDQGEREDKKKKKKDKKKRDKEEKKESKKDKKHKKRKRHEKQDEEQKSLDNNSDSDQDEKDAKDSAEEASKKQLSEGALRRAARRKERKELLDKLPKIDESTGLPFTKQQLRRMRKRLQKGLNPIESEQEKKERLQRENELKRQEEAELAGILYGEEEEDHPEDSHERDVDMDSDEEDKGEDVNETADPYKGEVDKTTESRVIKKVRRTKEVPSDYVCQACKNRHAPLHWIYDCPDKVTVRGCNQVSKKLKGVHNPKHKVFVSGLPFDAKVRDVVSLFNIAIKENEGSGDKKSDAESNKIIHCKLVKFPDTGRCKGQAYVTFASEEGVLNALKLSGTMIDNVPATNKKDKESPSQNRRSQLKLKVTKAINRFMTKKQRQQQQTQPTASDT